MNSRCVLVLLSQDFKKDRAATRGRILVERVEGTEKISEVETKSSTSG